MARAATIARGYSHPDYAYSLAEFGLPRLLPRSDGWMLERPIRDTSVRDLMGPYPLFSCANWSSLATDLEELRDALVSVVMIADPLADIDVSMLRRAFPDRFTPLKSHLVRDLEGTASLPAHHRRHVRQASAAVDVEICAEPLRYLDDWVALYAGLAARHGLVGIRAFSREAFAKQLTLPGLIAVRAERAGATVGMTLWLEDSPNAYYHLGAYSQQGYEVSASYALFGVALEHLRERGARWVDLGGAPGGSGGGGLVRFKRGWANDERPAYLCGRILNRSVYAWLAERPGSGTQWFPAYRAAEADLAGAPELDEPTRPS